MLLLGRLPFKNICLRENCVGNHLKTTWMRMIIKDWLLQLVVVWVEIIDNSLTSCCCYRSHNCSWFRRVVFFILDVIRHPTRITVIIPIERIIIHKISSVVCLEHLEELLPRDPIFLFIHESPSQNAISQTLKFRVFPWFVRVFGYVIEQFSLISSLPGYILEQHLMQNHTNRPDITL